jgi:hypothetical protein
MNISAQRFATKTLTCLFIAGPRRISRLLDETLDHRESASTAPSGKLPHVRLSAVSASHPALRLEGASKQKGAKILTRN